MKKFTKRRKKNSLSAGISSLRSAEILDFYYIMHTLHNHDTVPLELQIKEQSGYALNFKALLGNFA